MYVEIEEVLCTLKTSRGERVTIVKIDKMIVGMTEETKKIKTRGEVWAIIPYKMPGGPRGNIPPKH